MTGGVYAVTAKTTDVHDYFDSSLQGGWIQLNEFGERSGVSVHVRSWDEMIAIGEKISRLAREYAGAAAVKPDEVLGGEPKPDEEAQTPDVPQTLSL